MAQLNNSLNNKAANSWNKSKKNIGSNQGGDSGGEYQKFLEFLDSSGNSDYVRKKITQIEAFKKKQSG